MRGVKSSRQGVEREAQRDGWREVIRVRCLTMRRELNLDPLASSSPHFCLPFLLSLPVQQRWCHRLPLPPYSSSDDHILRPVSPITLPSPSLLCLVFCPRREQQGYIQGVYKPQDILSARAEPHPSGLARHHQSAHR